ncbi:hypothetical protein [Pseudoxanthomonas sp. PXM02]|uniref:hypothetical protein n=1 Tax=Pseudoxanthomonas sp. PXM02 TaxID=2769294 RepID=UPI00178631D2|nr:hypothetical protein [Pseudoxanthomonas sp. PXM02]MBD9477546.1 hypothetical protein [Pseudoxanthomonas sp. PXM02]
MKHRLLATLFFLLLSVNASARETLADNGELASLRQQDQADRQGAIDWTKVAPRDAARLARVKALIREGALRTGSDYENAAWVFQHGDTADDIRMAHALATLAMNLAPEEKRRRWLVAASWDRLLMRQQQPQWYATQFLSDATGMYLYPVAEDAVTDEQRKSMTGLTLAESRARTAEMARNAGVPLRDPAPRIEDLKNDAAKAPKGG